MASSSVTDQETFFAPAGRCSAEKIRRQQLLIANAPLLQPVIDAISEGVMVLNDKRQIVGANHSFLQLFGADIDSVVGKRPGEIVDCIRWKDGPDGCGTTKSCATCGAVAAILESQRTHGRAARECHMVSESLGGCGTLDLSIIATAFDLEGEHFTVCAITDISDQKRLALLSRMFFYDVMNTAGSIQGYAQLLADDLAESSGARDNALRLAYLADFLLEEIQSQRDLIHAEAGDLEVRLETLDTLDVLENLHSLYSSHPVANGRRIELRNAWKGQIKNDKRLLARVIGNMIKNALEATDSGGTVTVGCVDLGAAVQFSVHNASVMPAEVQLQVFQRFFSTKSSTGRGIGTHSMRLLGEHYLGGEVAFSSTSPEGTTFTFTVAKDPESSS